MNFRIFSIIVMLGALSMLQCAMTDNAKGLRIDGEISGAPAGTIHLDKTPFGTAFESLTTTDISSEGAFSLKLDEHPGAGLYRIRIGNSVGNLIFDGNENAVKISGSINDFGKNAFVIEGSEGTADYNAAMGQYLSRKMQLPQLEKYLKESKNAYAAQAFAAQFLKGRPDFASMHSEILKRLKADYPDADHSKYDGLVKQMEQAMLAQQRSQKIRVGMPAPEIALPDPNGKVRKLSDLKGKIVLLDFWASWCGPCRKANPHVVDVYNRYKDKGFDVFSVSLDGLGARDKQRMRLSDEDYAKRLEGQKKRWKDAIVKDKLTWPNHVSELKKWETKVARDYGVTGIPKTYLLDRDGNIAAVNPRFDLEEQLKKLL
jgi:thiol-disulfide isomerase/thioredoxin